MNQLIGRTAQLHEFEDSLKQGRLHHAWLFVGQEGLGKNFLAQRFAIKLLTSHSDNPEVQNQHAMQIEYGTHLDYRYIEVGEDSSEIKIDEIRSLREFLSYKPMQSKYRVVIVNAIDDLNNNAANALLKTLEEPNANTIIFLICHSLGRILPTIRSRCRTLRFNPYTLEEFLQIAKLSFSEFDTFELQELYEIGLGSLKALNLLRDRQGLTLYKQTESLVFGDLSAIQSVVSNLSNDNNWEVIKFATLCAISLD
jgi:DNA polymerase-3 subunit delta'